MRALILATALCIPTFVFAAGSEDPTPPKPTQTTTECKSGMVWDEKTKSCVAPQESQLDDDVLYQAAREFAYAGQYDHSQAALRAMSDQNDDRVLTYMGFTTRKMGDVPAGMAYYNAALQVNPDNILARSYMGQAFVEAGQLGAAREQLKEIQARGGRESWSETSLKKAIETGDGYSY
ncbi:tetratricopeptide repeat protein [Parasulfitobacter algicola]|uniref:Tetratricopeptide repeat protein n=1 Tax=Parasulfitobacter algicola TaxID=2614809 RepID=A0ABX2IY46_9RHOB|nr:tetratricopeptide repeat protein [Sulfitobacter algicola]NSX55461.1 tetratricopeptide repeat protein [Sulfitobacter algicola]